MRSSVSGGTLSFDFTDERRGSCAGLEARVASSAAPTVAAAVEEIAAQLAGVAPALVCAFASRAYPPHELAPALAAAFPGARTAGCTTAGELVTGRMLERSVVVMALGAELIGAAPAVAVVERVSSEARVPQAMASLASQLGHASPREIPPARTLGLVFVDGMSGAEERLMAAISRETSVFFAGGSAGDDFGFRSTVVFADGRAHEDAAVLLLCTPPRGFEIVRTQSFDPLPTRLVATKVDREHRVVEQFDGKPAAEAYAAAIGVPVEAAARRFGDYPLALIVDEQLFVRSPRQVQGTAMAFHGEIHQGMELAVLVSRDIVEDMAALLKAARARGPVAALLDFDCILRKVELRRREQTQAYAELFQGIPMVGFNSYGEQFLGHVNQTAVMVILR